MNPIVESGSATNANLFKAKAEGFLWTVISSLAPAL